MFALEPMEKKRLARSGIAGGCFWLAVLLALILIPVASIKRDQQEFPPIMISLATSSVKAATRSSAAPDGRSLESTKPSSRAAASQSRDATSQSSPAASSGGLGIPDFAQPVTSSKTDSGARENLVFSSTVPTQNPTTSSRTPNTTSETSGTAATVQTGTSSGAKVSSRTQSASTGAASNDTASALSGISAAARTTVATGSTGNAGSPGSAGTSGTGNSQNLTSLEAANVAGISFTGSARGLKKPTPPIVMALPPDLASLVESDRTVKVTMTVLANGSVSRGSISFSPASTLPLKVQDWLRSELTGWLFDPGDSNGQASFSYSIKVK